MDGCVRFWIGAAHYDLGRSFFSLFLDPSMQYSGGIYRTPTDSLAQAQHNKLQSLITKLKLTATDVVLEIGCGFGAAFAIGAAKQTGCSVVAITLSQEEMKHASERVQAEGLSDRVMIELADYRTFKTKPSHFAHRKKAAATKSVTTADAANAKFDAVVSVGHDFLGSSLLRVCRARTPPVPHLW